MIDKINQEIKELEREWEKLRNAGKEHLFNTSIFVQFRQTEEKLEQAKKDKKIIEEGLEDLYVWMDRKEKKIKSYLNDCTYEENDNYTSNHYLMNIKEELNEEKQKLKNQNE